MASLVHEKWTFQPLPTKQFVALVDSDVKDLLMKWNLDTNMQAKCFYYDKHFQAYQKDGFCKDFFQDPVVNTSIQVRSSTGQWAPLALGQLVTRVDVEEVPCTLVNMEVFDKLFNEDIVRKSGSICKCYEDFFEDVQISDELRKMLLLEDSDNYDLFSASERSQFLFRVFKHVCLGGQVCQFEDQVQSYLDTTKLLYKDLVSVVKDSKSGKLVVLSLVYKVQLWAGNSLVFPGTKEHEQSFCYVIVDPHKRHATCWYHVW